MMLVAQLAMLYLAASLSALAWITSPAPPPPNNSSSSVAGTWEDDPANWSRAFHCEQPANIIVVHSKYWRSTHWTDEYSFYFEVQASPEWRDEFLKNRKAHRIPEDIARGYRDQNQLDLTPAWFVPGPVKDYEVWDNRPGYLGSIWINKANGHIFFWERQV